MIRLLISCCCRIRLCFGLRRRAGGRPARTCVGPFLLVELPTVLTAGTAARARLNILFLDVVSFRALRIVVIDLAVRFLLGMPWICFHALHLLSNVMN